MKAAKGPFRWPFARFSLFVVALALVSSLEAYNYATEQAPDTPIVPVTVIPAHPQVAPAPKSQPGLDWFNDLDSKYQRLVTIIIATVMMLTGIFFVIFGYRIFRPTLAMVGFVVLFAVLWIVLTTHTHLRWWAVLLISLGGGLVAGLLCFFIYILGIALLGSALGFITATLVLSTPFGTKVVTNYWAHFGIILGTMLVFSTLAVIFQRLLIIVGTSALGAYLFCNAVDIAWLHTGILTDIIVKFFNRKLGDLPPLNTASGYGLLGGSLGIIIFGTIIQFGITARNFNHKQADQKRRHDEEGESLLVNSYYRG